MRRSLSSVALDRPVTVLVMFLAMCVLGSLAYGRIALQLMPDGFEPRFLWVQVAFPNASPAETDEQVVRPIQEELSTLAGLVKLRSRASSDRASFELEFQASVPMSEAYNDVVDRIERAMPLLPDEVDRYWVYKFNPADSPVLWVGLSWPEDVDDPFHMVDKVIRPRLERVNGVASLDTWGVNGRGVFIDYDRAAIGAHGIDLGSVQRALAGDNFQMSGGQVTEGGRVQNIRSLARIADIETFQRYPLRADGLVLGDIAEVSYRGLLDADINRVNGRDAAALAVRKESSANTVAVTKALAAAIEELEADPRLQGSTFFVFFDQGELISEAVGTLRDAAIGGGLLSVLILFAFLREWRMTLLISASIPFSMLLTVAAIYVRGESLNIVAMMGLMLAVGMVVDNAIVVVESIYRHRALGEDVRDAAVLGAGEVGVAIVASTATSMVVFLPVMLMTDNADAALFLGVLGRPVIFALGASLLVALVLAPLATRYLPGGRIRPDPAWLEALRRAYARLLDATLRRPVDAALVLLFALAVTAGVSVPGVPFSDPGGGGLNDFNVRFTVPNDATYAERDAIARRFEEMMEEHREAWGVRVYRVELDGTSRRGRVFVYLEQDGPMGRNEVVEAARAVLPTELPGVDARIGWDSQGGEDKRLEVSIYGEDVDTLQVLAEEAVRRVQALPGVLGAAMDDESSLDEIRLLPDEDALRRYGLDARSVATTVAFALRGNLLTPLRVGDAEVDVETRLSLRDRSDIDAVLDFPVFSPATMSLVPLRALTHVRFASGPGSIRRSGRRTSVDITVDLSEDVTKEAFTPVVNAALSDMALPRGYSFEAGQWQRAQSQEFDALFLALALSVIFVFLLMGVLFESWVLPLAVITTIPMAGMGASWGLYLTGTTADTMAFIGLVVLVGVVVNNGIVLVDLITQLRLEGLERGEAIRQACDRRLRPILMTAVTTIVGLIPMAMGSQDFAGIPYAPLGRCVIGGLTAATFLTLLYVPYLYVVLDDLREWSRRAFSQVVAGRT